MCKKSMKSNKKRHYKIILKFLGVWKVYSVSLNAIPEDIEKNSKFKELYSYRLKLRVRKLFRWLYTTEWRKV